MITEDQLEQICLEWFREGGYEYAFGPDIAHDDEVSVVSAQATIKEVV
jgi:type I restriction enzyme R subunit